MSPPQTRLNALTSIRFVAGMWAVLLHLGWPIVDYFPSRLRELIVAGPRAVSLFFVLSGFILIYRYRSTNENPLTKPSERRRFWVARFAKLYPVYVLALALMALPYLSHLGDPDVAPSLARHWKSALVLHLLGLSAWFPHVVYHWNGPGWSLSAEFFFYSLFPWLSTVKCLRTARLSAALPLLWVIGIAPSVAMYVLDRTGTLPWADGTLVRVVTFNPVIRLSEFMMGIVVGYKFVADAGRAPRWLKPGALVSAAALLAFCCATDFVPTSLQENPLLSPLFAILIYGLAHHERLFTGLFITRPMIVLGDASYALYIVHLPFFYLFGYVLRLFGSSARSLPMTSICIVLLVGLSVVLFRFVELPMQRLLKRAI